MGVIFDTSVLIGSEKASSRLDKFILGREEEAFGISVIMVSELLHGFALATLDLRDYGLIAGLNIAKL